MTTESKFIGQEAGVDVNGEPARLGEFDSTGHIVGYIDDKGNCWESLKERDCSMSAGRYLDEMSNYRAGRRVSEPDPQVISGSICINPEHVEAAVQECHEQVEVYARLRGSKVAKSAEEFVDRLIERFGIEALADLFDPSPEEPEED